MRVLSEVLIRDRNRYFNYFEKWSKMISFKWYFEIALWGRKIPTPLESCTKVQFYVDGEKPWNRSKMQYSFLDLMLRANDRAVRYLSCLLKLSATTTVGQSGGKFNVRLFESRADSITTILDVWTPLLTGEATLISYKPWSFSIEALIFKSQYVI